MTHDEKLLWMTKWARDNGAKLTLAGLCGFGRECVGILVGDNYLDYKWHNKDYERIDNNGEVWIPEDAYHAYPCVAVLGRGEPAESQLYEWLKWFDEHGFKIEEGDNPKEDYEELGIVGINRYCRLVK